MINVEHKELENFLYSYDLTMEQFIESSLPLLKTVYRTMQPKTEPVNIRYIMEHCLDDIKEIEGGWVFSADEDVPIYILWEEKIMKIEHDTIILSRESPDMFLDDENHKHTIMYMEPFYLSIKKLLRAFRIIYKVADLKNRVMMQINVSTGTDQGTSSGIKEEDEKVLCIHCNKKVPNTPSSLCSHKNKRCPKIGGDKGNDKGKNLSYEKVFKKIIT